MTLDAMQTALNEFEARGGMVFRIPAANPSAATEVQEAVGLIFPPELVAYYEAFDYLEWAHHEMMTLDQSARTFKTGWGSGQSSRNAPQWPVLDDGSGGYYFVVCANPGKRPPSDFGSVSYNPGCEPGTTEYTAANVFALIRHQVTTAMDFL